MGTCLWGWVSIFAEPNSLLSNNPGNQKVWSCNTPTHGWDSYIGPWCKRLDPDLEP
jgi:hypothetical protein